MTTATGAVHNTYLGLACEIGLLGCAAFLAFLGWPALSILLSGPTLSSRILLVAMLSLTISGLTISIENFRGIWAVAALIEAYRRIDAAA